MQKTNCYLCHSLRLVERSGSVRDSQLLKIYECKDCGLVQLNSHEHIRKEHYENSKMHGSDPEPISVWERNTEEDDERRFQMLKTLLPNKDLLDFGCGNGGFLKKAKTLASEVTGIELEERIRKYLHEDLQIFSGLDSLGERKYDLITAFHVIEHLQDPRKILENLKEFLSLEGYIVVEVPSASDALLLLYECEAFQNFTYWSQHLYLFNANTLESLAKLSGLKVIAIEQFQRYPLSNHLYWLSQGKPGGHKLWRFLDSPILKQTYADSLARIGQCDTLIGWFKL